MAQDYRTLPPQYHILPASIDFLVPDFHRFCAPGSKTLALRQRDCEEWFNEFADRVTAACGQSYLPVCRMSDGEYRFIVGDQPPDVRLPRLTRMRQWLGLITRPLRRKGKFQAWSAGHYHSGEYSRQEWQQMRFQYAAWMRQISQKGILALHLTYGATPFQENYHPAVARWLKEHNITLTDENYYPFYFVYALLTGPRRQKLFTGRRVLVVNGAQGEKRQQIEAGLWREGVTALHWLPISPKRSMFDRLEIDSFRGQVDLAVVGAGVGKPNVLLQLEPLQVPCIDAGFVFEVWANPQNKWKRAMCVPDDEQPQ